MLIFSPRSSTSLAALFHGMWKSFKTTGMCSRRHGEVVLEVRHLQKTDPDVISSYQQKEQAHHSSEGGKSEFFLLPQESSLSEKLLPDAFEGKINISQS
ncbi:hypothetical protein TNCV_695161 [Trichonephila clavipes]|nr:hypothetical protein TNCV_695161 [Trichonephila clavipes]